MNLQFLTPIFSLYYNDFFALVLLFSGAVESGLSFYLRALSVARMNSRSKNAHADCGPECEDVTFVSAPD